MATKIVTKNSSTASAVPTASDLVQGELAVNVADKRLFTENNAGAIVELGTNPSTLTVTGEITANGGIALGDNDKATFGAGDDLQLYHNGGSGNYIDSVNKDLYIRCNLDAGVVGGDILLQPKAGENSAVFKDNGAVDLYYDNSLKLATTSTGIDVTGNVTMATGGSIVAGGANDLILNAGESGTPDIYLQSGGSTKVKVEGSNGNVGIGLTAPDAPLSVYSPSASANIKLTRAGTSENLQLGTYYINSTNNDLQLATTTSHPMVFKTNNTERMRIDSSGNVGIGVAPAFPFHVQASDGALAQFSNGVDADCTIRTASGVTLITPSTGTLALGTSSTERMRIDSSGRLGLGVTPEAWSSVFKVLRVGTGSSIAGESGGTSTWFNTNAYYDGSWKRINTNTAAQIAHTSDGKQEFKVAASGSAGSAISWNTAMTVDNSGNLLVGKTSTDDGVAGLRVSSLGVIVSTIASPSTNTYLMYSGGYKFYVNTNGGISNFSANNVNLSDEREKKNIELLESQWDSLKQWSLKKFHYNADDDSDNKKLGVIAQEVATHNPEVIDEFNVDDDTTRMAVKEQQMMWMAIKALQEAQTRIETLEARVTELENN